MPRRPVQPADHRLARVTANPSAGIAALSEKALALIRWQPVQWQAIVTSGGAVTRTRPRRLRLGTRGGRQL